MKNFINRVKELINEHPFKMGLFIGGYTTLLIMIVIMLLI